MLATGLMHYVQNPGCGNTSLLQIWDNSDFGTVIVYANMINNFPEDTLMAFTGLEAVCTQWPITTFCCNPACKLAAMWPAAVLDGSVLQWHHRDEHM